MWETYFSGSLTTFAGAKKLCVGLALPMNSQMRKFNGAPTAPKFYAKSLYFSFTGIQRQAECFNDRGNWAYLYGRSF
jgi:hypothetical protein